VGRYTGTLQILELCYTYGMNTASLTIKTGALSSGGAPIFEVMK